MALQFIMGPPGSGKSHYLYEKVTKASLEHPETNYIVLVPEQFTMQTQKDLVMASPRKGIMNVDVLSFGRLAHRIFEETGGNQRTVLDDVGKSFVLRKIAGDCEAELRVLGSNLKKTGYIGEVKSVISEFTQYDIQEETLEQMIEEVEDSSNLYYKLQDIKTIYHGFREYLREKYITGEELLDVLCTVVGKSKILKDSVVVLDGFTGFTPVQNKILRELFGVCKKVVITVTMEQKENPFSYKHPYQLFALSKQMVTSLITIAKETKTDVEEPIYLYDRPIYRFRENTALAFLEAHLFRYSKEQYEKEQDRIQVYCAKNPKEEVDFAAQKIRNLARTRGYRYREIAIIASDLNTYGNQIEKIFGEYQIPIFMDHKRSILLNSFVEYVRSLLAMVEQNFSYESVFRYLRTGLTGFSDEEIDIVENYVIALGIRGYKKWQEKWIRRARGMEETELERINDIKERFLIQVEDVTMVLKKRNKTVSEVTKALYDFLVKEELQKKVKEYEIRFGNDGELALEKEYGQVYRIVIELFDKFVELLGEEQIALKEYCELLDAGLEEAKVGVIPPSLDQVVAGDIERTRIKDIKAVFLLGANDMYIPGKENAGGILSEHDRELLQKGGVVLAPGAKEKAFIQKFYLYLLMTKPSEQLYVTYSKVSADGKTLRPAYLIQDLRRMYKKMEIQDADCQPDKKELTPKSGFAYLIEKLQKKHEGLGTEWQELYTWYRQNPKWRKKIEQIVEACFYEKPKDGLTTRTAQRLYGTILENSVTRLEKFSACAYAHFLSYGLNLREREEYTFQAIDLGNIFHSAIEHFAKKLEAEGYTWTTLPEVRREELIEESVEESIVDYGNTILYSSARNEYIIKRLKRMMRRTVWALTKQLEKGDFMPGGYEISFGGASGLSTSDIALDGHGRMRLRGKIDRVDICEDEDNVYVKVIDYKTGAKAFDLGELYYGLQLQLVLYLNTALELESRKNHGKTVIPAGIFYYQMKDPIVDKEKDEEKLEKKILKELRLDGVVNAREEVVRHLDREISGNSLVVPIGRNKDRSLSKASKTATQEEFELISEYAKKQMKQIGTRILEGETEVSPYELGTMTGCSYCPYKAICGFEEKIPGYEYRRLQKLKKDEALMKMRKEVSEWE